jgi:hypothetical protein
MRREDWLTMRRLLAVCLDQPQAIEFALNGLRRSLPAAQVTVLHLSNTQPAAIVLSTLRPAGQEPFEAAILFTAAHQSPYPIAYLCYLAGIPIRIGQSLEFGGGVLSHWVQPPEVDDCDGFSHDASHRHLHLLQAAGCLTL